MHMHRDQWRKRHIHHQVAVDTFSAKAGDTTSVIHFEQLTYIAPGVDSWTAQSITSCRRACDM